MGTIREDIDENADRWKAVLRAPALRREFLKGASDDDDAVVKAFAHANRESALKTKPKVCIRVVSVSCFRPSFSQLWKHHYKGCLVSPPASLFVLDFDDLGFYSMEDAEGGGSGGWLGGRRAIEGFVHHPTGIRDSNFFCNSSQTGKSSFQTKL